MKSNYAQKIVLILTFLSTTTILAQSGEVTQIIQKNIIERGVGIGSVIAIVASWSRNKSILWAILHGVLSWLYVIYYALTRTSEEE